LSSGSIETRWRSSCITVRDGSRRPLAWSPVFGSGWIVAAVITSSATALALRHRCTDALFVAANATGTAITVAILKHAVGRPRPALPDRLISETGTAFPSGDAAQSIACYGALAVVMVRAPRSNRTRGP